MIEKKLDLFLKYKLSLSKLEYNVTNDNLYFAIDFDIYKNNDEKYTHATTITDGYMGSAVHTNLLKINQPFSISYYISFGSSSNDYGDQYEILESIIKSSDSMSLIRKLILNWVSELYDKVKEDENYKNKIVNYIDDDIWLNNKPYEKVILYDIKDKYGTKYGNFCLLDLNYKLITDF